MLSTRVGSFDRRRGLAALLTAAMLIAVAAVVVSAAVALNSRNALGAGGGGGGCFLNSGPVCTVNGMSAYADFSTVSADGCIVTDAFVNSFQGLTRPSATPGMAVFIAEDQYNVCTNTDIASVSNFDPTTFVPSFSGTAQFSKTLGSASVNGTAQMFDNFTGAPAFVATVNVTWQGYGPSSTIIDNSHFRSAGLVVNTRFTGSSIQALASGVITDGTGANLAAGTSPNASLQNITNGTVVVSH
jgi:hypothetical protein